MHVGLNLVYLVPGETGGMETYARELVEALVRERPELRLTAFVNREAAEAGGGPWGEIVPAVTVPGRARRRVEWVRGEQQLLPLLARRAGVDVLHSLGSTAPAWGRFRRVVTIHDLIYKLYPEAHGRLRALGLAQLVPLAARRSHRIIAPSQATRADLIRLLGVPEGKVDVVLEGFGASRVTAASEDDVRNRHGLGDRRIVLTVSAKRRHKNLERLLEALALIPADLRPLLVLTGYPTPFEARLRTCAAELGVQGDTRLLGWGPPGGAEGAGRRRGSRSTAPPRLGPRRGHGGAVPAVGVLRLPVALRGLRPPCARGDGSGGSCRMLGRWPARRGRGRRGARFRPLPARRDCEGDRDAAARRTAGRTAASLRVGA